MFVPLMVTDPFVSLGTLKLGHPQSASRTVEASNELGRKRTARVS
jgi:hypothetical protein